MHQAQCGIAVMAKASAPGRTKTRLVPPLTPDEAASINTAFLVDVSNNLLLARREGANIEGYMAYGPPGTGAFFDTHIPLGIGRFETWLPGFGACLSSAINPALDPNQPQASKAFLEQAIAGGLLDRLSGMACAGATAGASSESRAAKA